jgi:pheromone shutdown-related protein TraB
MTDPDSPTLPAAPMLDDAVEQPMRVVERDGVRYTLLGTAHVSKASVEAVQHAIDSYPYDAVAVELDTQRLQALSDPDAMAKLDLVQVIRKGRVALFAANLALAAYQRRLAEQLGIEPGAELKRAVSAAQERGMAVHLIDREVGLTFKRASAKLGFFGKLKLGTGLLGGLFASEEVGEAEIEQLKQGDMLEASFGEFAKESPALFEAVIAERDRYMAASLRQFTGDAREVLAVVGAGHLQGLARHLAEDHDDPATVRAELEHVQTKRKLPWIMMLLSLLVLGGIAWGFYSGGLKLGSTLLLQWLALTGGLAGLGCLAAAGHPLSILAAIIAAPLKPFRPGLPAGAFSALVEVHLRKPAYGDFLALRDDAQTLKGWYRNRVCRVVLTFLLTNLGSMLGFWITGALIAGKLLH